MFTGPVSDTIVFSHKVKLQKTLTELYIHTDNTKLTRKTEDIDTALVTCDKHPVDQRA